MNKEKIASFGEQLRALREETGMSIRKLADHFEIDSSFLSKIERNKRKPNKWLIEMIASYFKVDEKELTRQVVSDQIAFKIIKEGDLELLKDVEKKVIYFKNKQ